MQEWLNWLAWKASIPLKGIGGSNPPLSAKLNESRPTAEVIFVLWKTQARLAGESDDVKYKGPDAAYPAHQE